VSHPKYQSLPGNVLYNRDSGLTSYVIDSYCKWVLDSETRNLCEPLAVSQGRRH
jgi:hypothetical protein